MIVVWVALAGGLGAVARFVLDGLVRTRVSSSFPVGTVVVNVTGSFVLGLVTGLTLAHAVPEELRLVVGPGSAAGTRRSAPRRSRRFAWSSSGEWGWPCSTVSAPS